MGESGRANNSSYQDRVKQAVMLESDRPYVLRQAILACRNGGTVSVPGVYGGLLDKIPFGAVVNRALTIAKSSRSAMISTISPGIPRHMAVTSHW